ncbi:MAG: alpha/beta hydrolase [Acidimicrobiales bacterium]
MDNQIGNLERRNLTANGVEQCFLESGPDDGPLAICVHGFPDSAWTWRHLLPVLADAGFHAVAPFLRGYAPSGLAPDGTYQSGALAADICALKEEIAGSDQAVFIGHDWGAFCGYGATGWKPEHFSKLVTMAVPPVPAAASTFFSYAQIKRSFYVFFFQSALAEGVVGADDCAFIDNLWADWSPGYDAKWDVTRVKESIGEPERLSAAINYYRAMFDGSTHLAQYADAQQAAGGLPVIPTLYLHGADDGCMGVASIDEVAQLLPAASEAAMIQKAGHFLHLEQPDEVNDRVLRFIAG